MNTGKTIETERLLLIPGSNARDNVPFIHMLRNDGDFRNFCGIEFSERYLEDFSDYFERTGHEACKAVVDLMFSDGISADDKVIREKKYTQQRLLKI